MSEWHSEEEEEGEKEGGGVLTHRGDFNRVTVPIQLPTNFLVCGET